ncbi:hypothetical protein [Burkholderia gladioli]|uniref:hypothetical protein n=1 Tax=Burkholderia gladioli TaxID=28095 RepID=UPI00164088F4|nr:hypothetical protein [Burkholderia gladioli]MBU9193957.1 hypothetical protein [Burkholderia gladioli]
MFQSLIDRGGIRYLRVDIDAARQDRPGIHASRRNMYRARSTLYRGSEGAPLFYSAVPDDAGIHSTKNRSAIRNGSMDFLPISFP